jgi:tRNA (guanine9-N1)-methyltransferase
VKKKARRDPDNLKPSNVSLDYDEPCDSMLIEDENHIKHESDEDGEPEVKVEEEASNRPYKKNLRTSSQLGQQFSELERVNDEYEQRKLLSYATSEREDGVKADSSDEEGTEIKREGEDSKPLSKNQLKKLRKKAAREAGREEWKAMKKEKKRQRKERERLEREEKIKRGIPLPPKQQNEKTPSELVPMMVVIDCSFNELMFEHELKSLAGQVSRCYSENRRARYKTFLTVSSFEGLLKQRFEVELNGEYKKWSKHIQFRPEDFKSISDNAKPEMLRLSPPIQELKKFGGAWDQGTLAKKFADLLGRPCDPSTFNFEWNNAHENYSRHGEVVYLSSEGEETLTELKPYSTYIIGGLVDHNRHKGLCHQRAKERGVRTAKLPIGEYLKMSSRQVLATNHVFEILLKWLESGDWGKAFSEVVPKRKEWSLKAEENGEAKEEEMGDGPDVESEEIGDIKKEELEDEPDVQHRIADVHVKEE